MPACFKKVLIDFAIKKLICIYDNAISIKYVNKKNQRKIWDTQKSIEAVEKWALKKEELEKKIRKNNLWAILVILES